MPELVEVLGNSPRVRLLAALVHLVGIDFTRGELAREAELYRMTTNRQIDGLVTAGLIERVPGGGRPKYRVNPASPLLRVIYYLESALFLIDNDGAPPGDPEIEKTVDAFRRAVRAVTQERGARPRKAGGPSGRPRAQAPKRGA